MADMGPLPEMPYQTSKECGGRWGQQASGDFSITIITINARRGLFPIYRLLLTIELIYLLKRKIFLFYFSFIHLFTYLFIYLFFTCNYNF